MDQSQWVPDERAHSCFQCQSRFSFFLRRHHCRACGGVFCGNCTEKKLTLKAGTEGVRVCDKCYERNSFRQTQPSVVIDDSSKKDRVLYETRSVCLSCSYGSSNPNSYKFGPNISYIVQYKCNIYLYAQCHSHPPVLTLICSDSQFYRRMVLYAWNGAFGAAFTDQLLALIPSSKTTTSTSTGPVTPATGPGSALISSSTPVSTSTPIVPTSSSTLTTNASPGGVTVIASRNTPPRDPFGTPGVYYYVDPASTSVPVAAGVSTSMANSFGNSSGSGTNGSAADGATTPRTRSTPSTSFSASSSSAASGSSSSTSPLFADTTTFHLDSRHIYSRLIHPTNAIGVGLSTSANGNVSLAMSPASPTSTPSSVSGGLNTDSGSKMGSGAQTLPPLAKLYLYCEGSANNVQAYSLISSQINTFLELYSASSTFLLSVVVGAVPLSSISAVNELIFAIHESVNLTSTSSSTALSGSLSGSTSASTSASTIPAGLPGVLKNSSFAIQVTSKTSCLRAHIFVEATGDRLAALAAIPDSCFTCPAVCPAISHVVGNEPEAPTQIAESVTRALGYLRTYQGLSCAVLFTIAHTLPQAKLSILTDLVFQNRDLIRACVFIRERPLSTILAGSLQAVYPPALTSSDGRVIVGQTGSDIQFTTRPTAVSSNGKLVISNLRAPQSVILQEVASLIALAEQQSGSGGSGNSGNTATSTVSTVPSMDIMPLLTSLHAATGGLLSPSLFVPLSALSEILSPLLWAGGLGRIPLNVDPFSTLATCVIHNEAFTISESTSGLAVGQTTSQIQNSLGQSQGQTQGQSQAQGQVQGQSQGQTQTQLSSQGQSQGQSQIQSQATAPTGFTTSATTSVSTGNSTTSLASAMLPPRGFVRLRTHVIGPNASSGAAYAPVPLGPINVLSSAAINLFNIVDDRTLFEESRALLGLITAPPAFTVTTIITLLAVLEKAIAKSPVILSKAATTRTTPGSTSGASNNTGANASSALHSSSTVNLSRTSSATGSNNRITNTPGSTEASPAGIINGTIGAVDISNPQSILAAISALASLSLPPGSSPAEVSSTASGIKFAIFTLLALDSIARQMQSQLRVAQGQGRGSTSASAGMHQSSLPGVNRTRNAQMFLIVNEIDIGAVDILRRCRPFSVAQNPNSASPIPVVSTALNVL